MFKLWMALLFLFLTGCNNLNAIKERNTIYKIQDVSVALVDKNKDIYCGGVWVSDLNIITAYHCVRDSVEKNDCPKKENSNIKEKIIINYMQYKNKTVYTARIKTIIMDSDLALLEVDNQIPDHIFAEIGNTPYLGEKVHILGHPGSVSWTYTPGVISAYREETCLEVNLNCIELLQISAPIFFGNSGGGAFSSKGELIGIASFMATPPSIGFFIGIKDIKLLQPQYKN